MCCYCELNGSRSSGFLVEKPQPPPPPVRCSSPVQSLKEDVIMPLTPKPQPSTSQVRCAESSVPSLEPSTFNDLPNGNIFTIVSNLYALGCTFIFCGLISMAESLYVWWRNYIETIALALYFVSCICNFWERTGAIQLLRPPGNSLSPRSKSVLVNDFQWKNHLVALF